MLFAVETDQLTTFLRRVFCVIYSGSDVSVCSLGLANICDSLLTVQRVIKQRIERTNKQSDSVIEMDSLAARPVH